MTIASERRLRVSASAPIPFPLASYYERYADLTDEPLIERSKLLRLPAVTVATLRYTAPDPNDLALTTRGTATEASILLAAWRTRSHLTGFTVAEELHERYWPTSRLRGFTRGFEPFRNLPRRGFDLIVATDALGYVQWFADVVDPDDDRRYRTVRLSEALATFERSHSDRSQTSPQRTEAAPR